MNHLLAFGAWVLAIFIWVYLLPILIIGTVMCIPFFLVVTPPLLLASFTWFYIMKDALVPSGTLRSLLNNLPYERWFGQRMIHGNLSTPHLITSHPHGILCTSVLIGVHFTPGSTTLFAVSPFIFVIPFFGWLATHLGCIPATYEAIQNGLKTSSVILVPGGVPELVSGDMYTRRHGFLKIARACNVPILPLVSTTDYFHSIPLPFKEARVYIAKTVGIPLMAPPLGWYGTWVPQRKPIVFQRRDMFTVETNADIEDERKRYYTNLRK